MGLESYENAPVIPKLKAAERRAVGNHENFARKKKSNARLMEKKLTKANSFELAAGGEMSRREVPGSIRFAIIIRIWTDQPVRSP